MEEMFLGDRRSHHGALCGLALWEHQGLARAAIRALEQQSQQGCTLLLCPASPMSHTLSLPILAVPTGFYTPARDQHLKERVSYLTTGRRRSLDLTFHCGLAPAAPT